MSAHQFYSDMAIAPVEIPDPGNGGALPIAKCGYISLVTGASGETRTLGDPVRAGLLLVLAFKTDGGGDAVVTATSDITQTSGENVMTFSDAGEFVALYSIAVGSGFKWRQLANIGAALS